MSTFNRETTFSRGGPATEDITGRETGLFQATSLIERRLRARLDNIRRVHDLDWRALLVSHREVLGLHQLGVAPSALEFWSGTATPATEALIGEACLAIDEELVEFHRIARRFARGAVAASRLPGYDPTPFDEELTRSVELLAGCNIDRAPLDRLGTRWQAKLRRTAQRTILPKLLLVPLRTADALVARHEMALLEQAPWAHDDRLLSAFELAHADIRSHLRERLRRTSVVVPRRSGRKLVTAS